MPPVFAHFSDNESQGRLEARRALGKGISTGPFSPSAEEAGATARAEGALMTHAWTMEGTGMFMSPAEQPAPGEGLQLEVRACACADPIPCASVYSALTCARI